MVEMEPSPAFLYVLTVKISIEFQKTDHWLLFQIAYFIVSMYVPVLKHLSNMWNICQINDDIYII